MSDDLKVLAEAQALIARAKREGSGHIYVPVRLAEALAEKAQRPHD